MSALLYPVAGDGETALRAPLGLAARAREAQALAGEAVVFASERVGPPCATREEAQDLLSRLSASAPNPPEPGVVRVLEVFDGARPPAPLRPLAAGDRRWPEPPAPPRTVWRLQVDYWRLASRAPVHLEAQARHVRRMGRPDLSGDDLNAFARQPLRPVRPQQPLDIGLFEVRTPEDPDRVIADE